jgi:dihydrofolate reductase/thymidylate synthase
MRKSINLIVAMTKANGIGLNGNLPWSPQKLHGDMKFFKKITSETQTPDKVNSVIMGRKTWNSLPENFKPLPNRLNIVLTKNNILNNILHNNVKIFSSIEDTMQFLKNEPKIEKNFVIGGGEIYSQFLNKKYIEYVDKLYVTEVSTPHNSDVYFPTIPKWFFQINEEKLGDNIILKTYQNKADINSQEYNYLSCISNVLNNGEYILDRTKTGILSLPHQTMSFNIKSIDNDEQTKIIYYPPFMTTKSLYLKGVIWELIWFLSGNTNSKWLEERKTNIWKGNTSRSFLDNSGLLDYEEGQIGPGYGHQWVNWGGDWRSNKLTGINQIQNIIDTIKKDPSTRRAVLSAWNVSDIPKMALPPCHMLYVFKVSNHNDKKKRLNCMVSLRSNDLFLGCPFNIASASILTILISRALNMLPGIVTLTISDAHLYWNHIEQVKEQLQRMPLELPELTINKEINNHSDMTQLTYDDFKINNYYHHPPIKATMAI